MDECRLDAPSAKMTISPSRRANLPQAYSSIKLTNMAFDEPSFTTPPVEHCNLHTAVYLDGSYYDIPILELEQNYFKVNFEES